jgi:stage II sporulation protein D
MPRGVFLQALSDQLGRPVQDVEIADRSDDGRVDRLRLTHLNGTESFLAASVFRQTLNRRLDAPGLRSTLFDLSGSDGMIVIEGQGYGHGVGLGQWGALEMGRQGKTAHEIIQFYYRGVRVEPVYEADVFADLDTSPSEASAPEAGERREALLNRLGW